MKSSDLLLVFLFIMKHVGPGLESTTHVFNVEENLIVDMCTAQCESLCHEIGPAACESTCGQSGHRYSVHLNAQWYVICRPNNDFERHNVDCAGYCSTVPHLHNRGYVPAKPELRMTRQAGQILLSWDRDPKASNHTVYLVAYRSNSPSWNALGWVTTDHYKVDDHDPCETPEFKVASVSRYGSRWFSNAIRAYEIIPGPPRNPRVTRLEHVPTWLDKESIDYTVEFLQPKGWPDKDIAHFPVYSFAECYTMDPIHTRIISLRKSRQNSLGEDIYELTGQIPTHAIGCNITFSVRAVSRCNTRLSSPALLFTIQLKCEDFPNACEAPPLLHPGMVSNVKMILIPYYHNLLGLVSWLPPHNLGSAGRIEKYHLIWGVVDFLSGFQDIFFGFKQILGKLVVPGDQLSADVVMNFTALGDMEKIGIKVLAAGPHQIIDETNGMITLAVSTIDLSRSMVELLHVENLAIMQRDPSTFFSHEFPKVYMFWSYLDSLELENVTGIVIEYGAVSDLDGHDGNGSGLNSSSQFYLVLKNSTSFVLHGLKPNTTYALRIFPVFSNVTSADTVSRKDRNNADVYYFTTLEQNDTSDEPITTGNITESPQVYNASMVPLEDDDETIVQIATAVSAILLVMVTLVAIFLFRRRVRRKSRFPDIHYIDGQVYRPYSIFKPGRNLHDCRPDQCPPIADEWELPLSALKFGPTLGTGAFGKVVKGKVTTALLQQRGVIKNVVREGTQESSNMATKGVHTTVAIKMLQEDCDSHYKQDFLKEIQLMKKIGQHDHVVSILGCCTLRDPVCLIVEHMEQGDLLTYLKTVRNRLKSESTKIKHYVNARAQILASIDLLKFAWHISQGMDFLASKQFVHRDLAARNILIGANKVCKIGDFGLARYVYDDAVYVNRRGGRLPVKWMSIEAIFDMTFSTASDVWSYGVVIFEIVTLGGTPYPTIAAKDLLKELQRGYRMERPENCSQEMYELMLQCWHTDPSARPSFKVLSDWLVTMMNDQPQLQHLDMVINFHQDVYTTPPEDDGKGNVPLHSQPTTRTPPSPTDSSAPTVASNSEDSGYVSPQKESVSSGELSEISIPIGAGLDDQGITLCPVPPPRTRANELEKPRKISTPDFENVALSDDVFHEEICNVPETGSDDEVKVHEDSVVVGFKKGRRNGIGNEVPFSNNMDVNISNVNGDNKRNVIQCVAEVHASDTDTVMSQNSSRNKQPDYVNTNTSGKVQKRRKVAVVTPPTLALDNELYQTVLQRHNQQPPAVRIVRKHQVGRTVTSSNVGKLQTDSDFLTDILLKRRRSFSDPRDNYRTSPTEEEIPFALLPRKRPNTTLPVHNKKDSKEETVDSKDVPESQFVSPTTQSRRRQNNRSLDNLLIVGQGSDIPPKRDSCQKLKKTFIKLDSLPVSKKTDETEIKSEVRSPTGYAVFESILQRLYPKWESRRSKNGTFPLHERGSSGKLKRSVSEENISSLIVEEASKNCRDLHEEDESEYIPPSSPRRLSDPSPTTLSTFIFEDLQRPFNRFRHIMTSKTTQPRKVKFNLQNSSTDHSCFWWPSSRRAQKQVSTDSVPKVEVPVLASEKHPSALYLVKAKVH